MCASDDILSKVRAGNATMRVGYLTYFLALQLWTGHRFPSMVKWYLIFFFFFFWGTLFSRKLYLKNFWIVIVFVYAGRVCNLMSSVTFETLTNLIFCAQTVNRWFFTKICINIKFKFLFTIHKFKCVTGTSLPISYTFRWFSDIDQSFLQSVGYLNCFWPYLELYHPIACSNF